MFEKRETIETIPDKRKEVVNGLLEKGIEDAEVIEALNRWTNEKELMVESLGRTSEARLGFEVDRAKLYGDGGYIEEALDVLADALYVAQQEGVSELEERIRKEIALMESSE